MKLSIDFVSENIPSVDFKSADGFTPFGLYVKGGSGLTRLEAMTFYAQFLKYTFTGIENGYGDIIDTLQIGQSWGGIVTKKNFGAEWNYIVDKTNFVIYDVMAGQIKEDIYIADGVSTLPNKMLHPDWKSDVIKGKPEEIRDNLVVIIEEFTKRFTDYSLSYDMGKLTLTHKGSKIKIESIKSDDLYSLLKLITCLTTKGKHIGVFLIDCRNMSPLVIETMVAIVRGIFGDDSFLFLYNYLSKCTDMIEIELPNYVILR